MHRAVARLTAWASAWSGSPAALGASIGLPLASLVWGWSADWILASVERLCIRNTPVRAPSC